MSEPSAATQLALVAQAISRIESDLATLTDQQKAYVLSVIFDAHLDAMNARFKPLEKLVYGVVALVLIAVVGAIIAVVVISPKLGV